MIIFSFVLRMKEYERERRLMVREARIKSKMVRGEMWGNVISDKDMDRLIFVDLLIMNLIKICLCWVFFLICFRWDIFIVYILFFFWYFDRCI